MKPVIIVKIMVMNSLITVLMIDRQFNEKKISTRVLR